MEMQAHFVIVCHNVSRIFHDDISLLAIGKFMIIILAYCNLSGVIKPHGLLLKWKIITWIYNIA